MAKGEILIVIGSKSDLPIFDDAVELLRDFEIPYEIQIMSAHRTPDLVRTKIEGLPERVRVVIAAAGGAAHLAGVVAAHTLKPVIGVPTESKLNGLDSLLSTAQMPAGIPVATMSIGTAGATNAVLLAAQILALTDESLGKNLVRHRKSMATKIQEANKGLKNNSAK